MLQRKSFLFYLFIFSNRPTKKEIKRAEDRPVHRVKGAFCLFVFFGLNDVDMIRKEIRVDRVYAY